MLQLGELLCLTPLPSLCGIGLGDDLRSDYPDNAALLLGILLEAAEKLPPSLSEHDLDRFKNRGRKSLKEFSN
jgi:hypothetical protein